MLLVTKITKMLRLHTHAARVLVMKVTKIVRICGKKVVSICYQVDDADCALDGLEVAHVGALQAHLLVPEGVEKRGAPARLVEERCNGGSGRGGELRKRGRPSGRLHREVELCKGAN